MDQWLQNFSSEVVMMSLRNRVLPYMQDYRTTINVFQWITDHFYTFHLK